MLAATLPFVALSPATTATAAPFDPIASSVLGQPAASARTVADSQGTFHAVVDVGQGVEVIYQRSANGGKVWAPAARFRGEAGGAGQAVIAADGSRLAIGYLGLWCDPAAPNASCLREVPYLVTSLDGGRSWGSPVRLANVFTSDIQVAVDDDRVWVAFTSGKVELRGTTDGGRTFFASRSLPAYYGASLAAADQVMVLAYNGLDASLGPVVPRAVVADGRTLGPTQDLPAGHALGGWQSSAAAAEGRVHVLLRNSTTRQPAVVTADHTGAFAAPVPVGAPGYSTSIAARRGSVGVAIGGDDGVTSVAMSSNFGASYSAPVPVSYTEGGEPLVALGAAQLTTDRPMARFDWSVPDRFVDEDSDGLPEPANFSGDPSLDGLRVYAGRTMEVTLDGCGSRFGPGRTAADYTWYVDGTQHASGTTCQTTLDVEDGDAPSVRLEIRNDLGEIDSITQDVAPRDLLVVSIGDSIASGEGSPHVDGDAATLVLPTWRDRSCHRSAYAGPSLAARQMELADRRSSVTFIQLACSGAAMLDVPDQPGTDDPATGGLLDAYDGVEMLAPALRPSQLEQLTALGGIRPVDALLVSIGANDAQFSTVIEGCIIHTGCQTGAVRDGFDQRAAELPSRYARLADAIVDLGVPSANVYLTEYFDPTIDDYGLPSLRCIGHDPDFAAMAHFAIQHPILFPLVAAVVAALQTTELLDDDEARWAHADVMGALNDAARAATADHGWTYVGGIASRFDRHGYCASDPWVVRFGESLITQVDPWGAFHPNRAGQRVYGDAIFASLRAHLLTSDGVYDPLAIQSTDIGDFVVMTSTDTGVTAASVHSTGGQPLPGAVRRVDTADFDSGYLGVAGPPAVAGSAAAGAWIQVAHTGNSVTGVTARAAQLFVHPNAALQSVAIVQAPGDAATMVADRPTLVQANIDADIEGPTVIQITTKVTSTDIANAQTTLVDSVEQVTLQPGFNSVLLPTTATFTAAELDHVEARVEITDPPGAGPNDVWDNLGFATATAATSRALTVAFGPADLGGASLGCSTVKSTAERMVAFGAQAMPVSAAGIDSGLACTPIVALQPNEPDLLRGLLAADELARYMGADAFVLVVPDGWLRAAAGGALGIAAPGIRAAIVEASATDSVFAHELSHTLGLDHTGAVPAAGARVDRRQPRQGVDWMVWQVQPKLWTGGATWDKLLGAIGGPENAPEALDFSGGGTWVRGTVVRNPDGTWSATPGQWVRGGAGAPTPADLDLDELELERMTATQLNANGEPIGEPAPVGLSPTGGQYGAGAGSTAPDDFGYVYASRLNVDPAAVAVELRLDGAIVDTRPLTAPPTVAVTTPVAGDEVGRGEPLTVEWTMSDPDGDALTSAVLISDDGGASFRPLAVEVTGTSLTVPMPADVGGNQVVVRVVTSDGERQASADSGAFATPAVGLPEERVVFTTTSYQYAVGRYLGGIFTMRPDGSDVQQVPLPTDSTYRDDDTNAPNCNEPDDCDVASWTPAWGPDGRIYFASTLRTPELGATDPGDTFNAYDNTGTHIFSVNPDGTGLQRVTGQSYDPDWWPLAEHASANGGGGDFRCPAPSPTGDVVAWYAIDPNLHHGIWTSTRDGDGWARPVVAFGAGRFPASLLPAGTPTPIDEAGNGLHDDVFLTPDECGRWSADGSTFAVVANISYRFLVAGQPRFFYGGAIVEVSADGSNLRIVATAPDAADPTVLFDSMRSVEWLPDGNFLVSMVGHPESDLNRYAAFHVDRTTGVFTRLTPEPDATYYERPWTLKVSPDGGRFYGDVPDITTTNGSSSAPGSDFGLIDPSTGTSERIEPQFNPPSPDEANEGFDWALVAPVAPPALAIDPAAAPDDPNAPAEPTGDVVAPSTEAAPGAADVEGPSVSPLPPATVTIPSGVTTTVQLLGDGGTLVPYVVVPAAGGPGAVAVGAADGAAPIPLGSPGGPTAFGVGSSPGGTILLTAPADFAGTVELLVAPIAVPTATTVITVEVVPGNVAPVAVDDVVDVPAATATVIDPAALLVNDVDPDAGAPPAEMGALAVGPSGLAIVSVSGSSGGRAWLDVDGAVHVHPAAAGTSTFQYVVADAGGATATAVVTVQAIPDPTTTAPATSPPTVPPTDPPVTTAPGAPATTDPGVPATTGAPAATLPPGATAPPATTAAPPAPGTLPVTGANVAAFLAIALGLLLIGLHLRRRARLG